MEKIEINRSQLGEARYANYAEVGHNAFEFVFDFGQVWMDGEPARMCVRVVTTPNTAESVRAALDAALQAYRGSYGAIQITERKREHEP